MRWLDAIFQGVGAAFLTLLAFLLAVLALLVAYSNIKTWLATRHPPRARTPAAGPAPAPGPSVPPAMPHQEDAAYPPVQRDPAPGPEPHGGLVVSIDIWADDRIVTTYFQQDKVEVTPGYCPDCQHDTNTCHLCGLYTVYDGELCRWVRKYVRCPAHAEPEPAS